MTAFDITADGNTNFVGDALLPLMPKAATRFMTFALDTRTAIRRDDRGMVRPRSARPPMAALTMQTRSKRTIDYEVTAPPDEDREILVEEERVEGWKPAADQKVAEETPTRYPSQDRGGQGRGDQGELRARAPRQRDMSC